MIDSEIILTGECKEAFLKYRKLSYETIVAMPKIWLHADIMFWFDTLTSLNDERINFDQIFKICFDEGYLKKSLYCINEDSIIRANNIYNEDSNSIA